MKNLKRGDENQLKIKI